MAEAKHLFDGHDQEGRHNNRHHMHEMVCLLGEPPSTFLERSPHTWRLFGDNGRTTPLDIEYAQLALLMSDSRRMEGRAAIGCHAIRGPTESVEWRKSG